jgi:hypothetical protein
MMMAEGRAPSPNRSRAAPWIHEPLPVTPASIKTHRRSPAPVCPKNTTLTIKSRWEARSAETSCTTAFSLPLACAAGSTGTC